MKKTNIILSTFILSVVMASSAFAAGLSFSPSSGTYAEGGTYTVSVYVNPAGKTIYTAKAEVKYPADLLEVRFFSLASGWMALSQSGYDQIDNSNGVLIKTGGYTEGLKSNTLFGTITFYAKNSGSANVSIGNGSLILDDNSKDVLTSYLSATFTLSGIPAPVPVESAIEGTTESAPLEEATDVQVADVEVNESVSFVEPAPINVTAMALGLAWANYTSSFGLILLTLFAIVGIVAIANKDKLIKLTQRLKKRE
ncbi:cohesin domain-containing protein [Patescibacteria group bacterium]|nr:cohesin domain-containing protein [Patescibacteria group bacterium]